jgi:hypothetical protein
MENMVELLPSPNKVKIRNELFHGQINKVVEDYDEVEMRRGDDQNDYSCQDKEPQKMCRQMSVDSSF